VTDRIFAAAAAIAIVACSPSPPAPATPIVAPIASSAPSAPASAAPRPPRAPHVPREAHVSVSVMDPSGGGTWSDKLRLTPDPVALAKECYVAALDDDSDVAGWLYVDLQSSGALLGETSALPRRLTTCIAERFRRVHPDQAMLGMPNVVVYVSLSSTPITAPSAP
jgi:hypothetical protein